MSVQIAPIMHQNRKINVGQMNEEEFEKILQVLQKDFELRQKEQHRLSKIQEDIEEENKKVDVLSKQTKLNDNVCIRCCQTFGIIFNRKQTCQICKLFICKSCCLYDRENKGYICHICAKDRELKMKSCEWFYDNVSKKFKRFGSAKVVRTLYKQKRRDSARKYHSLENLLDTADNESDSGYDPSLLTSKQYGSLQSLDRLHQQVVEEKNKDSDTEGFDPVIPAPVHFGSSVKPPPNKAVNINHDQNENNHDESESRLHEDDEKGGSRKEVSDIYKEAFENAKSTEEKKFHIRFDGFMSDFQKSLGNLLSNGVNPSYSNNPYGDVMINYRGKLKDLIVSLSQRLEIVIESFDSSPDDPLETTQKVRQLVSRLVTENFGESLDLGSDEAVSDLSSLSEESSENVKSYEDQLAHAVVSKVLENHRKDHHLDFCLDDLDGRKDEADQARNSSVSEERSDTEKQFDSESLTSDNEKCDTVHSNSTAKNVLTKKSANQNILIHESADASIQCEPYEDQKDKSKPERPKSVNEMVQCDIQTDSGNIGHSPLENNLDVNELEQVEKCESVKSFSSSSTNVENEFEKLRSFAMDISSRNQPQSREVEEYLDELPIEEEKVDRSEGRQEFASRYDTFDRVHDDTRVSLPSLDDYDYEYGSGEVDPDLLSMNLAPIMEEDEEEAEDDLENEEDEDQDQETEGEGHWKGNWILKNSSGLTPYTNLGQIKKAEGISQVYMTIPQPNQHMSPRIGHRDVDQMSDLSDTPTDKDDVDVDNLSDEESSFYEQTSAEISRITKKSRKNKTRSSSVQTDESDADDVRRGSYVDSSTEESVTSKKKNLIEEYVPADDDDPKFEIPPDSVEVPEGEPAKFTLRVGGTVPINVFWYKVEDDLVELLDSEQYETSRDGNRCYLTIYNPTRIDGGQYMAMAINEKGQCCQYMILTIKKNKQELKKPEFLKEIQDVDATEGQSVKFRCKVKGYPQPRICWYKDGKLLANDDSYKMEKFGNRDYILTIDFASMNDDAEYTVVAKNIAGEAKSVAQLIVDTDEVKPAQPIRKLPTSSQRKDDVHLTNLNRKMFATKADVTNVAEDMLIAANEKTAAENVRKTTGRAMDIVESADNLIDSNRMDCLATSTPRSSEESIHTPRSKKDTSMENKPKWLQFVKEDGDIPTMSLISSKDSSEPIKTSDYDHVPLSIDTSDHVTSNMDVTVSNQGGEPENIHHSKFDNIHVSATMGNSGHVTHPGDQNINTHTLDTSFDSSNISSDLNDNLNESEPTVINFGAKPVNAEFYSRDYVINNNVAPSKPPRKKWEVKTDPYSSGAEIVNKQKDLDNVEEKIYMSASNISNLESKIHNLQQEVSNTCGTDKRKISELEEHIAQTVAQTCRSDRDVGGIERSVEALHVSCPASPRSVDDDNMSSPSLSIDSGFSSIRERPQPTIIIGTTGEDELPESRTELNEETGVELPSVNRLKQLFASSAEEDPSFKRVHSITARSLGKDKVEKIRTMAKSVNQTSPLAAESSNQNVHLRSHTNRPSPLAEETSNENKTGRSQITVTLAPVSHTKINDPQPTQIFPKNKGEYFPSDQQIKSELSKSTVESQPMKKTFTSQKTTHAPPLPSQSSKSDTPSDSLEKKKTSRIRAGCINARAKFWEKKIQGDSPSTEEEFPSMVEHIPD